MPATIDRMADLSPADHEQIRLLSLAVYPPEQFKDWPGRHLEWSSPEVCVRLRREDHSLASFVGVYLREANYDGRRVRIGGIGNVKTHPEARGRGFAADGIRRAIEFFKDQSQVAFALLFCEPRLLDYYGRLGWHEFTGRLLVRQNAAPLEFTFCRVMTHAIDDQPPVTGAIDLCGPPW
jgi:hypothetical protein